MLGLEANVFNVRLELAENHATVAVVVAAIPNPKTAIAGIKIFVFFIIVINFPFEGINEEKAQRLFIFERMIGYLSFLIVTTWDELVMILMTLILNHIRVYV